MKLFVTRHGETTWNVEWKVSGVTDVELTSLGISQAENAAKALENEKIDIIFASPLKRARHTAEIINSRCNAPIIIDPRLTEQDYGIYEGVHRKTEGFLNNKRQFAVKYPGGESMFQVGYRVYAFLEEIKKSCENKNVLLVTHGGVCRVIRTYFEDMTNEEYFNFSQGNCEIRKYET